MVFSSPWQEKKNFFQENKPISASPPFPCVNIWPTQYLPFPNSDTQGRWTSQLVLIWMKPASNILSWKIFPSVGNEFKLEGGKNCDEDEFVKSGHCPILLLLQHLSGIVIIGIKPNPLLFGQNIWHCLAKILKEKTPWFVHLLRQGAGGVKLIFQMFRKITKLVKKEITKLQNRSN